MYTNPAQRISRLKDGSIDYAHYLDIGNIERHRAIRSFGSGIPGLIPRPGPIVMVVALATLLPLLIG